MTEHTTDQPAAAEATLPAPVQISSGRKLLFLLVICAIGYLGLECAVRVRDMFPPRRAGFFDNQRSPLRRTPDAVVPFRIFGVRPYTTDGMITSRHGDKFPLRKPDGVFRIVCLGGSTTECRDSGVRYPEELQRVLRQRLGRDTIEVINLGNSAYATPHLLIHMELDVLSWDADLVIVMENINDLLVNYFPGFKPDYTNAYGDPYFSLPDFARHFNIVSALMQYSQVYWILLDRYDKLNFDGRYTMHRESWGDRPLPARDTYKRNLRSIARLAAADGVGVLFSSQPLDPREEFFDRHNRWKPYNWKVRYPLHAEFLQQHASYNQAMREAAEESGALFIDSAAALCDRPEFFVDHVHYSDDGVRALVRGFADFLIERGVLK
ncbi:MAG: hypothetical protein CHACPFDD_02459 [Phycisphaerae bacterium]|nr:hypothetical protein [Phycisphaerae bacterium]